MSEIEITTTGEVKLCGDVVGRITWMKPFVESDVAGRFSHDDQFVDEWGARIDCTECAQKNELLDDLDGAVARARGLLRNTCKNLKKLKLSDEAILQQVVEINTLLGNLDFET